MIYIHCNLCIHLEIAFQACINETNKVLNTIRVVSGADKVLWFHLKVREPHRDEDGPGHKQQFGTE